MSTKWNRFPMRDAGCGMQRPGSRRVTESQRRAFTLIEIMVVVAIMGLILATGIPSIYRMFKKEGMRQAVGDVLDACSHARARAILQGSMVEIVFHPLERRFEISGGSGGGSPGPEGGGHVASDKPLPARAGQAGQFTEEISIEMLDINLLEYRESETARVRFFPNGTSDELTLILHSSKNEWRKITLEVTTGLASQGEVR